jgi:microcystin-dependent protein
LFSVIGTTWGAGDATTTFNIPDIGNRLARGTKSGTLAPNAKAGAELTSVTLVAANLPQHRHGFSSPGLLNVTSSGSQQVLQGAFNAGQVLTNVDQTYAENGSTPVVSLPFNVATTNPYVAIPYIVKYAQ